MFAPGLELLRRAGEGNTINRIHAENLTSVCVDVVEPCVDWEDHNIAKYKYLNIPNYFSWNIINLISSPNFFPQAPNLRF